MTLPFFEVFLQKNKEALENWLDRKLLCEFAEAEECRGQRIKKKNKFMKDQRVKLYKCDNEYSDKKGPERHEKAYHTKI